MRKVVDEDSDLEVSGIALPVLDDVISSAREWGLGGDPVIERASTAFPVETREEGGPISAIDALPVLEQLEELLTRLDNDASGG
jgi:hypothetical protein